MILKEHIDKDENLVLRTHKDIKFPKIENLHLYLSVKSGTSKEK